MNTTLRKALCSLRLKQMLIKEIKVQECDARMVIKEQMLVTKIFFEYE